MKKIYEIPSTEVIGFGLEQMIAVSGIGIGDDYNSEEHPIQSADDESLFLLNDMLGE